MPDIAKYIYSVDSEFFLLISSSDLLEDTELIHFVKHVIKLHLTVKQSAQSHIKKIYNDFKSYCLKFFETLTEMACNNKKISSSAEEAHIN